MKPFFSVLMPFYNSEDTLEDSVTSVLESNFKNWELILVDDGSTDRGSKIAQDLASQDPRLKLISIEHRGLVGALNEGLTHCRAPWVARLDADDLMTPTRLSQQKQLIESSPQVKLVGGRVELFPKEEIRGGLMRYVQWLNSLTQPEEMDRDIFVEAPISHAAATFNKEVVEALGGYREGPWPEDYDLWLRIWESGHKLASVPSTVLKWRHRAGRLTFKDSRYSLEAFRQLKVPSLLRTRLKNKKEVALIGAGKEGKAWYKILSKHNLPVKYWVDVNPKKIGQSIQGTRVLSYQEMKELKNQMPYLLVSVGIKGAREQIREELTNSGFKEIIDFTCVA